MNSKSRLYIDLGCGWIKNLMQLKGCVREELDN